MHRFTLSTLVAATIGFAFAACDSKPEDKKGAGKADEKKVDAKKADAKPEEKTEAKPEDKKPDEKKEEGGW